MIPLFETGGKQTKPFGMAMCQNRMAVPTWSYAMEGYPPSQIVEIGSLNGGFTTAIGVHAWNIGCRVFTFDTCASPDEQWKSLSSFFKIEFFQQNVFDHPGNVKRHIELAGRTFLFCDGGDKPREFKTFAPYLKPGDIIGVHDYDLTGCKAPDAPWPWSEIKPTDIADTVIKYNLRPFMQDHFDLCGWLVYQKQ